MYTLLYEGKKIKFETLDNALEYTRDLAVAWTIYDPDGNVAFDWMDRVGP